LILFLVAVVSFGEEQAAITAPINKTGIIFIYTRWQK